ncbi:interferon-induced very large GTPase 1-like [Lissotriton helveticus]
MIQQKGMLPEEKEPPGHLVLADTGRQQIEKILDDEGLDRVYWLPKLEKALGVTSAQAIKHVTHEDYLKLEPYVKHPWEKQALKKVFGIPDSKVILKKLQEDRSETMKKAHEQAKVTLTELKEMQTLGKSQDDEEVKRKLENLRVVMSIPKECWPPSGGTLIDVIQGLHKELTLAEGSLSSSENLEDNEVLQWASGGRILEGIYKTDKLEDILEKRDHLMSIPENFSLFGPDKGPEFQTKEFSSSTSESTFTKVIESLGFSVCCKAKVGYLGVSLETSRASESDKKRKLTTESTYICTTKYNCIPLASCFFQKHQVRLSAAALCELKKIEALLGHTTKQDQLQMIAARYGKFFSTFGSHVDMGPFHLGGIYTWKASAEGFKAEDLEEIKRIATKSLNMYVGASFSGVSVSAVAGVGLSNSKSKSFFQGKGTESIRKKIQLSVSKTGGPVEVDSLAQWKSGLVSSNKTWCVIDRGFNLLPVWDIILESHRKDFKDVHQVAKGLMEAYKIITKQNVKLLFGEELASAVEEARAFLQEVESWEITHADEQLKKLIDFKQKLNEKTKNYSTWINECLSSKALSTFLTKVMKMYETLPEIKTVFLKTQVRCLVDYHVYSSENAYRYSSIIRWVYQSQNEQKRMYIASFDQFIHVLQEENRALQETRFSSHYCIEAVHEAQVKSTCNIGLTLYSLLKALRATEQKDLELLLLSFVLPLGYSLEISCFPYLLGCSEIDFTLNEMQAAHKEYLSLKNQSPYRAHAFLLLTGLTVAVDSKEVTPKQKKERLCFMMDHIKDYLSMEVSDVVQKHDQRNDLKWLEQDLHNLVLGNYEETEDVILKERLVGQLNNISKAVTIPTSEMDGDGTTIVEMPAVIKNKDISDLIQKLGLENYYPMKMTQEHVHVINRYTLQASRSQPLNDSELPFFFLQKLMVMDYRARDMIYRPITQEGHCYVTAAEEIGPPDENLDIMEDLFGFPKRSQEMPIAKQAPVHPMDVQMAIYHCADDFLRQWIAMKLSICQFALPFLVPNPSTSKVEFPLWSFRQVYLQKSKIFKMTSRNKKHSDRIISGTATPMVSFFRMGRSENSKSQLMNTLLSEHSHNIFFHRHCRGSRSDSVLMAGVAEIFWYCPSGKEDDQFQQCIAFTNLHGDALEHVQQTIFLQQISVVNVILFSSSDKNSMNSQILRELVGSPKPLICLCVDLENCPSVRVRNVVKIPLKNRNESELIDELVSVINSLLSTPDESCTLDQPMKYKCTVDEWASVAQQHGFLVDEDTEECSEGRALAKTLMCLLDDTKVGDVKEQLLPLQGSLWHRWCEKDKELTRLRHKGNRSIEEHVSDIESEKNAIRKAQVERAYPLNDLMMSLITILQSHSNKANLYFLHWLKVLLYDLSSDQLLKLHQQYHVLWSTILEEKGKGSNLNNAVYKDLEILSSKINASMFGLEHLLREVGQIYEALDALLGRYDDLNTLPQIAANLMAHGFPIELMDGDASYVPLKWIRTVLDELIKKIGDKKLFVLSVLGVQSTGKSTLLNTMFGLQFAVSAGRCTRGAFMQLVKVDHDLRQDLGFDFILVVDTEGLRATELANKSTLNHDNELATFVIGLGNMTLINIYGENPSEIQDILQIAVQAFLRMKQVKLSPSCLFVHQNVGDLAASDKNMEGRRRLQQKLDEMTRTAAQQELCDVTCFSDVITFYANSHIYNFSHLWEGNPPMAPLNPKYSQNVQELRSQILNTAKKESQSRILSISQLSWRIQDLWKALLNENFVFSFKNTLEISAYSKLETKFNDWSWQIRSHILNVQNKYNNRIKNGDLSQIENVHIEEQVQENYDSIKKDLDVYFTQDRDYEILVQWRVNVENRLQVLKQELIEEIKTKCGELIRFKKGQSKLDQKKSEYEDNLFKKSKDLALKLKHEALDEKKLADNFNELWIQWVAEVSSSAPSTEHPNIMVDVENAILGHFRQDPNIIAKVKDASKRTSFCLDVSEHVQMKRNRCMISKTFSNQDNVCIIQKKEHLEKFVCDYTETKRQQKMDYNGHYIHEILNVISNEVQNTSNNSNFKLTVAYQIDLSLYLCNIAAQKFIIIHKEFQLSNDPVAYLESKRGDFFNCFKISCEGATSITTFSEFLSSKIEEAVQHAVYDVAALKVADLMRSDYPAFNGNRAKLEKHILIYLAEKEDFEQYRQYIHFTKDFFETFIETCVQDYCTDKENQRLKNILSITLDSFQNLIISAIGEATQVVKDRNGNESNSASLWLDALCRKLGDDLNISRNDLKGIEHQQMKDLEFLKEAMCKTWESRVKCLKQRFGTVSLKTFRMKPHEILAKQLCGCWEQCPFCKAICTNTVSGHDGDHSVHYHRPQAVSGIQWYQTDNLVTDICSSLVASNCLLVLSDKIQIPYRNYRQAGPAYADWSIMPDTSSQSYWKWYVHHFQTILEKDYGGKFAEKGTIPSSWTLIRKENVIAELKEL